MSQEFEGQEISEFIAVIPSMKLEAPDSYQRGTYLTLSVEVRVRSVRYEEVTSGKHKGDLQKVHVLAIENVGVTETVTPQQRRAIFEAAEKQLALDAAAAVLVDDDDDDDDDDEEGGSNTEPTSQDEAQYKEAASKEKDRQEAWINNGIKNEVSVGF